ncbi:hypothetical protein [Bacillus xiapuensis]|uniref:hypothetical protein n=1 Tax=Bacillus xiapuensis TaxID=2014075 RepID=UPI0012FE5E67|nr:hypothetical protein [Bacillus xiapuensis]
MTVWQHIPPLSIAALVDYWNLARLLKMMWNEIDKRKKGPSLKVGFLYGIANRMSRMSS